MGRDSKSFGRLGAKYKPQPTVLVLCEDTKSGKNYLSDAAYSFRVNVLVAVAHCGKTDPLGIVEAAVKVRQKYDRIFCVIDRDRHEKFDDAIRLASSFPSIEVIASFPCFELWYLLHFGMVTKPYTEQGKDSPADCLIKDLRTRPGMDQYDKGDSRSLFEALGPERLATARKLSPLVLSEARKVKDPNPSTRVHELFEYFEVLAVPQSLAP